MTTPLIGLLDCNNFFVSCERLFRPDLLRKPVMVLSSNDGCVVARSQEVKDIGVPMGVPYFKIKDIAKKHDIATFSSHFALYRDISSRVMAILHEELARVEQYSVDEAFFVVKTNPESVARRLKQLVEKQVGIPVSIGIAATKTQAKYANDLAKKGSGIKVFTKKKWDAATPQIPLSEIWGVGRKMESRYKLHGLITVLDLLEADPACLDRLFGIAGLRLQQELKGISAYAFHEKAALQHSVMSSRSFRAAVFDQQVLVDAVAYHVRHTAANLRQMGLGAKKIQVSIRPGRQGDFVLRGGSREAVLTLETNDTFTLLRVATQLLGELYEPGVPYKKAGVALTDLQPAGNGQQSLLFAQTRQLDKNKLLGTIDAINAQAGKELVVLGGRLRSVAWQARRDTCSPAYTTRWKDVVVARAT